MTRDEALKLDAGEKTRICLLRIIAMLGQYERENRPIPPSVAAGMIADAIALLAD